MTTPIDKGWSWVILAASFGCSFLMFGTLAGGGVLYVGILDQFEDATHGEIIWTLFLMQICLNFMGPVAGYLGHKYTYRKIVIIGGFVAATGLFSCYFAKSVRHLFATYGLVYGLGLGLVVTPHIIVVNLAFDKYRGLANGIFSAGASVGSFAIPPILELLTESYGLRGLYVIWSAVILHIIVFGAVYRPTKPVPKPKHLKDVEVELLQLENLKKIKEKNNSNFSDVPETSKSRFSYLNFLANRHFWMVAIGWSGATFGISCFAFIIIEFATTQNKNISRTSASFLMSIWAIGDLIGRISCGFILDRKWIKLKTFYIFAMILSSITAASMQFFVSYNSLAVCSFFFGLALGASFVQHSLLLIATLGIKTFERAFGYLSISAGIVIIGLTLLVGFLREVTQSHHCNFTLIGFMLLLAPLLWVVEIGYINLLKKKDTRLNNVEHDFSNEKENLNSI